MFKVGDRVSYIWRGDGKKYRGTILYKLDNLDTFVVQTDNSDIVASVDGLLMKKLIKREKDIFMKIIENSTNPEEFKTNAISNYCNFDKKKEKPCSK